MSIATDTLRHGGGTFTRTGSPVAPDRGYAVALVPNGESVQCGPDPLLVAAAVRAVRARFPRSRFVGTWVHDGTVYIDPVEVVIDRDAALALARSTGQIAVWSFATGEEITL